MSGYYLFFAGNERYRRTKCAKKEKHLSKTKMLLLMLLTIQLYYYQLIKRFRL